MVCKACGTSSEPKHPKRAKFCSARCRVIVWRAEREAKAIERALAERDHRLQSLVATLAREAGLRVED